MWGTTWLLLRPLMWNTTTYDFARNLKILNNQKQTDTILLDFKKHLTKYHIRDFVQSSSTIGIRGTLLTWINDFLTGWTQQVIVDGCSSDDTLVSSGVPQGTVLALDIISMTCQRILYHQLNADDVLIYRIIESELACMIT